MQHVATLFVAVATTAWSAASAVALLRDEDAASGSIVGKVVAMLEDMAKKANEEKKAYEDSYFAFSVWSSYSISNLTKALAESDANIEAYTDEIDKYEADAETLRAAIAKDKIKVVNSTGKLEEEKATREKNHGAFKTSEKDYSESVDALRQAIVALEKKSQDVPALLQLADGEELPTKAKDMISIFAEFMTDEDGDDTQAAGHAYVKPKADVYEFQSHTLISMLEGLLDSFTDELSNLRKEEMSDQHNSDMIVQDLIFSIDTTKDVLSRKQAVLTSTMAKSAAAKKKLAKSEEVKAADDATLSDVKTETYDKYQSFTEQQQLRTEELEALNKAIEILSHEDVQGLAGVSLLQTQKTTALGQLGDGRFLGAHAETDGAVGIRKKLSAFLSSEAKRLHSSTIEDIAEKARSDPFETVKILIRDLMERLLKEMHEDTTHQGWCDKELGVNQLKRESLTSKIDGLDETIADGSANIMAMTQESAQLTVEVANLNKALLEANIIRNKDSRQNDATMRDCKKGEEAVREATALLNKFYSKAARATLLLQGQVKYPSFGSEEWHSLAKSTYRVHTSRADSTGFKFDGSSKEGMQTFGDVYVGQQDEAGGVLAMLDVILSDFTSLRIDTQTSESDSKKAHEELAQATAKDMAAKNKKIELLGADITTTKDAVRVATSDRRTAQDMLDSALRTNEDLKKDCSNPSVTSEERKASREAEIQSLKEALKILSYEDIAASADDLAAR